MVARPSIKDIAKETELSIATISKYLRNVKIKNENKIKIEEAVKRLGYVPNRNAQLLRSNNSFTIGIVLADLSNPFWGSIIDYIEEYLQQHGYMTVIFAESSVGKGGRFLSNILSHNLDGIIVVLSDQNDDACIPIIKDKIPVVLIDQKSIHYKIDTVSSDNYGAGVKAAEHLLEMGHTEIGIVTGWRHLFTIGERVRGFIDYLHEHNCTIDPKNIIEGPLESTHGKRMFAQLMNQDHPPKAIFTTNLDVGLGVLLEANAEHFRIGKDISIIAMDDDELLPGMVPPITVISQNVEALGVQSAKLLLKRISQSEPFEATTIYIDTKLIVRNSVCNNSERGGECQ